MVESEPKATAGAPGIVDPLVGKVLHARFRIVERIGAGGMGTVYKAVQSPLDRLVALKVLNPNYGVERDPGFQKRFLLEASVTAKLRHPNTIHVIDYGQTDEGIFYIAMEYVEGITLAELLRRAGPLPWPRALSLTQQISRSLREAHRAGVIHRDLKPANVMIIQEENDQDQVKVLDFGLVKFFLADKPEGQTEITQAGVFLGSPQYVSPEQARNKADPRSDIYSLGVMLYQMLMGRPPFLASESIDVIMQHLRESPPPFAALRPEIEVPAEVEAVVMRCLAKNPAERFQSMDELIEAVRQAGALGGFSGIHSGVFTGPTPPPITNSAFRKVQPPQGDGAATVALRTPRPATPRGPRMRIIYGIIALLVVAIGGLSYAIATHPGRRKAPTAAVARKIEKAPPAPKPPPTPHAASTPIVFQVDSSPSGATVSADGTVLGQTPLSFSRVPDGTGTARAMLTFTLAGYVPVTVKTGGAGPEIRLTQVLKHVTVHRLRPRPKPRPKPRHPTGYKDDPYQ